MMIAEESIFQQFHDIRKQINLLVEEIENKTGQLQNALRLINIYTGLTDDLIGLSEDYLAEWKPHNETLSMEEDDAIKKSILELESLSSLSLRETARLYEVLMEINDSLSSSGILAKAEYVENESTRMRQQNRPQMISAVGQIEDLVKKSMLSDDTLKASSRVHVEKPAIDLCISSSDQSDAEDSPHVDLQVQTLKCSDNFPQPEISLHVDPDEATLYDDPEGQLILQEMQMISAVGQIEDLVKKSMLSDDTLKASSRVHVEKPAIDLCISSSDQSDAEDSPHVDLQVQTLKCSDNKARAFLPQPEISLHVDPDEATLYDDPEGQLILQELMALDRIKKSHQTKKRSRK